MCVNVRCSHKKGGGGGGKLARGSLVSGKQAKAVVPRKWPQLFHSFIHSFARCLICPFQCCLYVCVCVLLCVCAGFRFGSGPAARLWTPSLTVESPRARRAATQHARNIHFKA